jgi:hypothetical protein
MDGIGKRARRALLDAGEDADRVYLERLSKDEEVQSPRRELPFSLSGGTMPSPPPESGMSAPNAAMARFLAKKKFDIGDFSIGGTGVNMDGKNKLAATEFNYENNGLSAGIVKPVGGRGDPMYRVGVKIPFKKGGTVRSKASKRADGIATKGFTRAK